MEHRQGGLEEQKQRQQGRFQHIMLLTDGAPTTRPPRSIPEMIENMKSDCTINMFGIGYDFDSLLLSEIAEKNCGSYCFIWDVRSVQTVLVHALANLRMRMATNVNVTLEASGGATFYGVS